jgi:hypothetical protein
MILTRATHAGVRANVTLSTYVETPFRCCPDPPLS